MRGLGTGKSTDCLVNYLGDPPPGPAHPDLDEVIREKPSSDFPRYVTVPALPLQDPYAGMNRYQLIEILTWAWTLNQDPRYPELFRQAWLRARDEEVAL